METYMCPSRSQYDIDDYKNITVDKNLHWQKKKKQRKFRNFSNERSVFYTNPEPGTIARPKLG